MIKCSVQIFLVATLLSTGAGAAQKKVSIPAMEKRVRAVQKETNQLAKDISLLEKNLGVEHGNYLATIKARQDFENRLSAAEKSLQEEEAKAQDRSQKLRLVLNRLALQKLDQNQNAPALAANEILSKQVQIQLAEFNEILRNVQEHSLELSEIRRRINDYVETENRLAELVKTMEAQKKEKAEAYLVALEEKSKQEEKLSSLKLTMRKTTVKKAVGINARFSSPLEDFLGVEYDKKGITYKFNGHRPVVAAEDGEVAYAGRLSTYGNVILIDHGAETRSVILGQFVPKLTKGHKVKRGDVLGYTERVSGQGKIYFEVRKSDKVVETVSLMDDEFLNKHRITKI